MNNGLNSIFNKLIILICIGSEVPVFSTPIANLSTVLSGQITCTVPEGLSPQCTRALKIDCQRISQCNGDRECLTNRPRVDISACDEDAPTKPVNPRLDEGGNQSVRPPTVSKRQTGPSTPGSNQASAYPILPSQDDPSVVETIGSTEPITSDPTNDVQLCSRALSAAQSACNVTQANSFSTQLASAPDGVYGAGAANAGLQNVNNIVLNCSNSQSLCSSTCGNALSSWRQQCGDDCNPSVQSAVGQLSNAKSACDGLSSNLQYLSSAANNSINLASAQVGNYLPSSAVSKFPEQRWAGSQGVGATNNLNGKLNEPSGHAGYVTPSGSHEGPASFDVPTLAGYAAAGGESGRATQTINIVSTVKTVPNGSGGGIPSGTTDFSSNANSSNKGTPTVTEKSGATDIDKGFRSGGYVAGAVDGSGFNVSVATRRPSTKKIETSGFSLLSYFKKWFNGGSDQTSEPWAGRREARPEESFLTRLGNDTEIYMESLLETSQSGKSFALVFMILLVVGFAAGWTIWIAKDEYEEHGRRVAQRRGGADRRVLPMEKRELERRSNSVDRRVRDQRTCGERRLAENRPRRRQQAV